MLVVDDIFQHLDDKTGLVVFESLRHYGSLPGKCVVFASSQVRFAPFVDRILCVRGGETVHDGNYPQVKTELEELKKRLEEK